MKTYKAIVIDDYKTDRIMLQSLINQHCTTINIIGEYKTLQEAQQILEDEEQLIAFISLKKEDINTKELLSGIYFKNVKLIFLIEDESQILDLLKHYPVDFLVKPVELKKLIFAVNKSLKQFELENEKLKSLVHDKVVNFKQETNKIFLGVSTVDKIDIIKIEEIFFCMAEGKYTSLFLKSGSKVLSSRNLGEYETILNNNCFFRIHNSYLVNLYHVAAIDKRDGVFCTLSNGVNLPIAKRRLDGFNRYILVKN